ncbi:protein of unknown function [Pseudomonas reinekei]|uniref:DUF4365 domain-containing protein n=1 Tax=Pseudomonas reinekei TaxID=395598 RepID=A0A1H0JIA5_PSERE|nr:DUF4365 domain-containing protein [Pseudomonas reinekei]KAB0483862.1 DUF4365 domain-containing protein [Pseudomonas reinekei]OLU00928.1 hypothetical protein BVK86_20605 [Pseudomonas reinekei]SDO43374.1 protein of unknown function [Pseudomonas reinekei]
MTYQPVERQGVAKVDLAVSGIFGWIFREQPIVDYGIDGLIEYVVNGAPQGRLISVQIKSGDSYLNETKRGLVFYGEPRHLDYWLNHSNPVLLIVYTPRTETLRWVHITETAVVRTSNGWNVVFPPDQFFDRHSTPEISKLFYTHHRQPELLVSTNIGALLPQRQIQHIREMVNTVATNLRLPQWHSWICYACCDHLPKLSENFIDGVKTSAAITVGTIYPSSDLRHLRIAIENMIRNASTAIETLLERAEYIPKWGEWWGIRKFEVDYLNPNSNQAEAEHEAWLKRYLWAMKCFVKSVNLFADIVRELLDPNFFLATGKFLYYDDEFARPSELQLIEYSDQERFLILEK